MKSGCDEHTLRTILSWHHGLGALRNAEHSHALADDNYYYGTPTYELLFLFFL
jgi:hypothetical protein